MRQGTCVELDDGPYIITEYQHVKPGKGGAFVRLKLKGLVGGGVLDRTLKSGESLELADVQTRSMQYIYAEGPRLVFMDQENFEQVEVDAAAVPNADLLAENCEVSVLLHNQRAVGVDLPNFVILAVAETDPPQKGVAGRTKPATLESGATVQVPVFIDRGEKLKIDTRDRSYVERA